MIDMLDWLSGYLDEAYWLAAFFALIGALAGNRLAWPLLASFVFCQFAQQQEWPFDRDTWATVDSAVLLAIGAILFARWRKSGTWPRWREWAVMALFAPALVAYLVEPAHPMAAYVISSLAAIAQLLLAFPWSKAWARIRSMPRERDRWNEFDLMVRA